MSETKLLLEICEAIDNYYLKVKHVIGKTKVHSLGHKKELMKQNIETLIKSYIRDIKQKVADALNECFEHDFVWKGTIQVFPNAIYKIHGKKILKLYKELKLDEQMKVKKNEG